MSELSDFWQEKRQQLAEDYRDASGEYVQHCGLLAVDLARLLQSEGKSPSVFSLRGISDNENETKTLVPLPYEGRVRWGGHVVCVAEGLVYDPILKEPESWETYPQKAFGEDEVIAINRDRYLLED